MDRSSGKKQVSLGRKLLVYLVLFSLLITVFIGSIQLYFDYRSSLNQINDTIQQIELSFIDNIENSVWLADDHAIRIQLQGMMEIQDIQFVEVKDDHQLLVNFGKKLDSNIIAKSIPLTYEMNGESHRIGDFLVQFSLKSVHSRLWAKVAYDVVFQGILIFLISFFAYLLFYMVAGRYILQIADHFQSGSFNSFLTLKRTPNDNYEDELDILVSSVNNMVTQMELEARKTQDALDQLEVSERKYREYIDHSPEAIFIVDRQFKIIEVNKAAVGMMGYSPEEMIGESIKSFWAEGQEERAEKEIEGLRQHGFMKVVRKYETKQGNFFYLSINISEIIKGLYIGFGQDITEQVELENQLKNLNENLQEQIQEELEKTKYQEGVIQEQKRFVEMGQMINSIAHQWRQPLNNIHLIMQMVQSIQEGDDYEFDIKDLFQQHEDLVHFMSKTIDDFRNYFATHQKEKTEFKVVPSIVETAALTRARLSENKIDISFECKCDKSVYSSDFMGKEAYCDIGNDILYGHEGEFRQIIINIINNAQDAIIENRQENTERDAIHISVKVSDEEFHIIIANTGSHINDDVLPRIFDPYFTTKEEGKGTGIGLFMTKTIVKNELQGKIYARNNDNGVEFHLMIPRG